ncbi:uncharacterized protein LOC120351076 [Nilaparvata lugens]|uniref:uncharacterized protein LOC120351076 n=1 Tax=Nilaparvata lugens TaxID=108931 RepID=UPI00193DBB41|nr:uncharacterized protein LOC120351076 [Nilaparvata lugens]
MTIEQTLMRSKKSIGGLTHGRGIRESVLTKWTLGMTHMQNICDELEAFAGASFGTSEQHVDSRISRINRDTKDAAKLQEWLSTHHPFPENSYVMSISSGIIEGSEVNCHMAREVGSLGIKRIIGDNFAAVKFRRKDEVTSLATVDNGLRLGNVKVTTVNPLTLFQRVCLLKQSDSDIQDLLTYELAPYPMSLFTEEGIRKGTKSSFY